MCVCVCVCACVRVRVRVRVSVGGKGEEVLLEPWPAGGLVRAMASIASMAFFSSVGGWEGGGARARAWS